MVLQSRARNPKYVLCLGDQYPLDFDIKACCDVCEVTITTTLPEGVTFMRSHQKLKSMVVNLTWEFGHMEQRPNIPAKVWLSAKEKAISAHVSA